MMKAFCRWLATAVLLASSPVMADDAEVTIDIITDEEGGPEAFINRIELPDIASDFAVQKAELAEQVAEAVADQGERLHQEVMEEVQDTVRLDQGNTFPLEPDVDAFQPPVEQPGNDLIEPPALQLPELEIGAGGQQGVDIEAQLPIGGVDLSGSLQGN